jgi:hypothetical protein
MIPAFAQDAPPPQLPFPHAPSPQLDPGEEARKQAEKDMAKQANKERQEQLKKDTDSLLKLATELKVYVDQTNENILSLDVIKKAEQIEKLARSVKEKMRAGYGPATPSSM